MKAFLFYLFVAYFMAVIVIIDAVTYATDSAGWRVYDVLSGAVYLVGVVAAVLLGVARLLVDER